MKISEKYRSKQLTPEFIEQASKGGLKFEMYLIPEQAEWIIKLVAEGSYADPAEALFHMLNHYKDFVKYEDLVDEVFKRTIQESIDEVEETGVTYTMEEIAARFNEKEKVESVVWEKDSSVYDAYGEDDGWVLEEGDVDDENVDEI